MSRSEVFPPLELCPFPIKLNGVVELVIPTGAIPQDLFLANSLALAAH